MKLKKSNIVLSKEELELAKSESLRCLSCPKPQCKAACPIENEIPSFIKAFKSSNINEAYSILMEKTCFPDICSIVCPHEKQCMGHCIRNFKNEPVNIPLIERAISELHKEDFVKPTPNGHKFAAIGSGPASLAFALILAKKGHKVVVYEKEKYIGGVLKWGIPAFRLPSEKLQKHIEELKSLGVEFVLNYEVGPKHPLDELIKEYEGIFIGVGATISNKMRVEGEDFKGVYHCDEFLSKINLNEPNIDFGKRILVVGGGNAAMDAARSAIRIADEVNIVYRRSEEEMPACKAELEDAKSEGVKFNILTNPVKFIGEDKVSRVECAVMELGEPDESGRRRPVESNKPHIFYDVDSVVLALGFSNNFALANEAFKLETDKWGAIIVNENNETSIKNVYTGGDAVRGASTVVLAMKDGINAAKSVLKKYENT